jgi:hypothetical protein
MGLDVMGRSSMSILSRGQGSGSWSIYAGSASYPRYSSTLIHVSHGKSRTQVCLFHTIENITEPCDNAGIMKAWCYASQNNIHKSLDTLSPGNTLRMKKTQAKCANVNGRTV